MKDELLSLDELGFEEWSLTPNPETLVPDSMARERERESFRSKIADDPAAVVVSHTDADGLTSAALLSMSVPYDDVVIQTVGYQDPHRFEHVLQDLTDYEAGFDPRGSELLISDFNSDSESCTDYLTDLAEGACDICWYDHQWATTFDKRWRIPVSNSTSTPTSVPPR